MAPSTPGAQQNLSFLDWGILQTRLCWVYDDVVPPSGRQRKGHDARSSAWLLRRGTAEMISAGGKRSLIRAGHWIFPPPDRRWQDFSADAHLLSVNFEATWPNGEKLFAPEEPVVLPAVRHAALTKSAEALARFVGARFPSAKTELRAAFGSLEDYLEMQKFFAAWLQAAVAALVGQGVPHARLGKIDNRLVAAVRRLDTRPIHEPDFEKELIKLTGLSVSQINRIFSAEFGMTPKQYFERRRAEVARVSLRGSDSTAKQVAYKLGFRSLSHFSVWFQKHEGCAPRQYRKAHLRPGGAGTRATEP